MGLRLRSHARWKARVPAKVEANEGGHRPAGIEIQVELAILAILSDGNGIAGARDEAIEDEREARVVVRDPCADGALGTAGPAITDALEVGIVEPDRGRALCGNDQNAGEGGQCQREASSGRRPGKVVESGGLRETDDKE